MKYRNVVLIALAQVLCMSLWFSFTAAIPAIRAAHNISNFHAAFLSGAVSIGFVIGTIANATTGIADKYRADRLFILAAGVGTTFNFLCLLFEPTSDWIVMLRLLVGLSLAGVYPIGMKLMMSWSSTDAKGHTDSGLLVGTLVGALTLGTALPHAFSAFGTSIDWRASVLYSSVAAALGCALMVWVRPGSNQRPSPGFDRGVVHRVWSHKPTLLANFGYLGHMWELYAMWSWFGFFVWASLEAYGQGYATSLAFHTGIVTFLVIAAGAAGCIWGGYMADRVGRTHFTSLSMAISGTCALVIGLFFAQEPVFLIIMGLIWGFFIVADSAQFSACIRELNPPAITGTMLSLQTGIGFLLSLTTIYLMPVFVDLLGWRWAFAPLAIGPLMGIIAMQKLRKLPESRLIANGRK